MKEIEILFNLKETAVEAKTKILNSKPLDSEVFREVKTASVKDDYYYSEKFDDLNVDKNGRLLASFRLREKDGKNIITYKHDHFDGNGVWQYSDEHETSFSDYGVLKLILEKLHFKPLVTIHNVKTILKNDLYEIVLEQVEGLGSFIEIEYDGKSNLSHSEAIEVKGEMIALIAHLGISVGEELNAGKPELMLKSNGLI